MWRQAREVIDERRQVSAPGSLRRFGVGQIRAVENIRLPNLIGMLGLACPAAGQGTNDEFCAISFPQSGTINAVCFEKPRERAALDVARLGHAVGFHNADDPRPAAGQAKPLAL